MITISRNVARQIATIFRRVLSLSVNQLHNQLVFINSDQDGLVIRSASSQAAVEYRDTTNLPKCSLQAPLELFKAVGSTKHDIVTITAIPDDKIQANWQDGAVPRTGTWSSKTERATHDFPAAPTNYVENPPDFLAAIREAIATTDANPTRFALNCLRLRGSDGSVAATDGRQVFKHAGFELGFTDDVLFYPAGVFDSKDLPSNKPLSIGRTDNHIVFKLGNWSFHQHIEKDRRFPRIEDVIQQIAHASSTMKLHVGDAGFLIDTLKRLPGTEDTNQPVTVDLNGRVAIRSKASTEEHVTELVLTNSHREGDEVRLPTDRRFLSRAAELRFDRVHFRDLNTPAVCQDDRRTYVWALLDKTGIVTPDENATVIESPTAPGTAGAKSRPVVPNTNLVPIQEPVSAMKSTSPSPVARKTAPPQATASTPSGNSIEQAIALRNQLRVMLANTNELIRSLKRQKQQQRLMQSTLASLRQLQTVA